MSLGHGGGQVEPEHKVGGVAGGAERASPGARLVHGAPVDGRLHELGHLARLEPDHGDRVEQDLGVRLGHHHGLAVPARSLDEQALQWEQGV